MVEYQPLYGYNPTMFERILAENLKEALSDTPVVMVVGARQTGKSTLALQSINSDFSPQYLTLDDPILLSSSKSNPTAFLENFPTPLIIDEIQRVPELFLPLKLKIDRERKAGSYLLTGSANVLNLPKVADSLAGRIEILHLQTLSQSEIEGTKHNFVDEICQDNYQISTANTPENREELFRRMLVGGYPEVVGRKTEKRREAWFDSYILTLLQRDLRDLANIEGLTDLPRLLKMLATRAGSLLNFAEISRSIGFPQTTLKRYVALLENIFLFEMLPAWSGNLSKRLTRTPKLFFSDTGLLAHLHNLTWSKIQADPTFGGFFTENFVYTELRKQIGWSNSKVQMFHFRTLSDLEIDFILELPNGEIIGIEVKSAESINDKSFKTLRLLQTEMPTKFKRGFVMYSGHQTVPFGDNLFAVPISSLWQNSKH